MINFAKCYKKGEGVLQSTEKFFEWILKAAEAGDIKSMVNVGLLYIQGESIKQDYYKAKVLIGI